MSDLYDLIVIGGGRSGSSAASAARQGGLRNVLVVERGQGITPQDRMNGDVWFGSTAVGLLTGNSGRPHTVVVRQAAGTARVKAPRILVATGSYEVPREALAIPGSRPSGVMTPALALDLMDMGLLPGRTAVVYGGGSRAGLVARRFLEAGGRVAAWVVPEGWEGPTPEAIGVDRVLCGSVQGVRGYPRLTQVEAGGESISCDTLIVATRVAATLAVLKGSPVQIDKTAHTVEVDEFGRTSVPGVFACGTCVRPDLEHRFSVDDGRRVGAAAASDVSVKG